MSLVVLAINIMAFISKDVSDYLYIFDLTYAVGNSAHLLLYPYLIGEFL
ncbi:hypothetical protein [Acidiplasma cupricumulans]|nr:hypothetical protein [Acidiplasma cupricumulans]